MAPITDEQALRSALHDATLGQPEAPIDRVTGVRRRHVRRRQIQGVAAAAAVAVVAAGAIVVGGGIGGSRQAQELDRPSWALPWADTRDGSVPQNVLAAVVTNWAAEQRAKAPLPASQPIDMPPVAWYAGKRVPGTDQVLAVFEATGLHAGDLPLTQGTRLVVATAAWDDVRTGTQKASTNWRYIDVAAPQRGYPGFIGGYLPVPTASGAVHNVVWLLTSPSYRRAHVTGGVHDLHDGFVTFDAGELDVRVEASIEDAHGRYPAGGYIGVPGAPSSDVPTLASAGSLTGVPRGRLTLGESSSQGSSTYQDLDAKAPAGRATTVYARCYSAGDTRSIRVAVDADDPQHLGRAVTIPCDLRQHVVPGNRTGSSIGLEGHPGLQGHEVVVRASDLVAWTVAVVIASR